jgi:hypothetical protein
MLLGITGVQATVVSKTTTRSQTGQDPKISVRRYGAGREQPAKASANYFFFMP